MLCVLNGTFFEAGFDCVSLDPTQFKELFRRHFGVLLNARELGVLVRVGNLGDPVIA